MNPDLSPIFNRFAGKEVNVIEKKFRYKGKTFSEFMPDYEDPTIVEMEKAAHENGLTMRLFTPGLMGTADWRDDRVNVRIEQGDDKKWRIGKNFSIG